MSADAVIDTQTILPAHIEQTIQAIARLHAAHQQRATPMELFVDRMTGLVSRPAFVGAVALAVALWIAINLVL